MDAPAVTWAAARPSRRSDLPLELLVLCLLAFLAGLIDSIVGGGGLVQVPALFVLLPGVPAPALLGTNKLASVVGTLAATVTYARRVPVPWGVALAAVGPAATASLLGARVATLVPSSTFRPIVLVLLALVAIYTYSRKSLGAGDRPELPPMRAWPLAALTGALVGLYDGFLGPGTGSFLVFAFVGLLRYSFLRASATAKVVNVATNGAALAYFAVTGNVLYAYALPMGLCNVAGSMLGARLAVARGSGFVRALFLGVVAAVILRYAYDIARGA